MPMAAHARATPQVISLLVVAVCFDVVACQASPGGSLSCTTRSECEDAAMLQLSRPSSQNANGGSGESAACVPTAPPRSALIVVDMQYDFINGTLPVPGGVEIIPTINALAALEGWAFVGYTMDFHPHDHASFAASHPEGKVFSKIHLDYTKDGKLCGNRFAQAYKGSAQASCQPEEVAHSLEQTLWPTHCVQHTLGSNIHHDIVLAESAAIVRKGFTSVVDSYGAFESRIGTHESNLASLLRLAGVRTVYVTGLALDYCVKYTSLQATVLGLETVVVEDATKAVAEGTGKQAIEDLVSSGIRMAASESLLTNSCN